MKIVVLEKIDFTQNLRKFKKNLLFLLKLQLENACPSEVEGRRRKN